MFGKRCIIFRTGSLPNTSHGNCTLRVGPVAHLVRDDLPATGKSPFAQVPPPPAMRRHTSIANKEPHVCLVDFRKLEMHTQDKPFEHTPTRAWVVYDNDRTRASGCESPSGSRQPRCTVYVWAPIQDAPSSAATSKPYKPTITHCATRQAAEQRLTRHGMCLPSDFDNVVHFDAAFQKKVLAQETDTQPPTTPTPPGSPSALANARYVIVHEPMLEMNSVDLFEARVQSLTGVEHRQSCMYVPLSGESDVVLYSQQLADAVFAVQGAPETRVVRRLDTLHRNLHTGTWNVPERLSQTLRHQVTEATHSHDARVHQQSFVHSVQDVLLKLCHLPTAQRVGWNTALGSSTHLCTTPNVFGFTTSEPTNRLAQDLVLADVQSSCTYVSTRTTVQLQDQRKHKAIEHFYSSLVPPLCRPLPASILPHVRPTDSETTSDRFEMVSRLNVTRHELLLHQVFTQFKLSPTVPIATLWHKSGSLNRQLIRTKYHQDLAEMQRVQVPSNLLLVAYKKAGETRSSLFKTVDQPSKRHAHFLEFVVCYRAHLYLVTLDRKGYMRCVVRGFSVSHTESNCHSERYDSTANCTVAFRLVQFVQHIVPLINRAILEPCNAMLYAVPGPGNPRPCLVYLRLHANHDQHRVLTTHNTYLRRYSATHTQKLPPGVMLGQLVYMLRYLLLPFEFKCADDATTLSQCVPFQGRALASALRMFDGDVAHTAHEQLHGTPSPVVEPLYAKLDGATDGASHHSTLQVTAMAHSSCPRFRILSSNPVSIVTTPHLPKLTVLRGGAEFAVTFDQKTWDIDAPFWQGCPMHPHVFRRRGVSDLPVPAAHAGAPPAACAKGQTGTKKRYPTGHHQRSVDTPRAMPHPLFATSRGLCQKRHWRVIR